MTNEELAIAIKAGQKELITELWGQCEKVIHFHASQWAQAWKSSRYDFDYDLKLRTPEKQNILKEYAK